MDAQKIFTAVVEGRNSFTPVVEAYYKIDDKSAIELARMRDRDEHIARGTTFEGMTGVTVVRNGVLDTDASTCFPSMDKALEYINSFGPTHKVYWVRYNAYGDMRKETVKL